MNNSAWDRLFCIVGIVALAAGMLMGSDRLVIFGMMVSLFFGWSAKHSVLREELAEIKERLPK